MFSCEYSEIFRNAFFYRTPLVAVSEINSTNLVKWLLVCSFFCNLDLIVKWVISSQNYSTFGEITFTLSFPIFFPNTLSYSWYFPDFYNNLVEHHARVRVAEEIQYLDIYLNPDKGFVNFQISNEIPQASST